MNIRRLFILVWFDLFHSILRLKGLVFLIPFFCFWLWIFNIFIEKGTEFLVTQESFAITYFIFRDTETVKSLLLNNPPTLSVFFVLTVSTLPFFVMLAGNNQLAGDASTKTFRYLLVRSTRLELFLSRFISSYLLLILAVILTAIIAIKISMQFDMHPATETINYSYRVLFIVLIYSVPFFAYMTFVSSFMSSALGTLLMSIVIYLFLSVFMYYSNLEFSLLPNGLKENIFNPAVNLAALITGSIIYTSIYIIFGWIIFRNRNL